MRGVAGIKALVGSSVDGKRSLLLSAREEDPWDFPPTIDRFWRRHTIIASKAQRNAAKKIPNKMYNSGDCNDQ